MRRRKWHFIQFVPSNSDKMSNIIHCKVSAVGDIIDMIWEIACFSYLWSHGEDWNHFLTLVESTDWSRYLCCTLFDVFAWTETNASNLSGSVYS